MSNPLSPESVLFNVSFHIKTSNRMNNIESGERGFKKNFYSQILREEYQMFRPILQLSEAKKKRNELNMTSRIYKSNIGFLQYRIQLRILCIL